MAGCQAGGARCTGAAPSSPPGERAVVEERGAVGVVLDVSQPVQLILHTRRAQGPASSASPCMGPGHAVAFHAAAAAPHEPTSDLLTAIDTGCDNSNWACLPANEKATEYVSCAHVERRCLLQCTATVALLSSAHATHPRWKPAAWPRHALCAARQAARRTLSPQRLAYTTSSCEFRNSTHSSTSACITLRDARVRRGTKPWRSSHFCGGGTSPPWHLAGSSTAGTARRVRRPFTCGRQTCRPPSGAGGRRCGRPAAALPAPQTGPAACRWARRGRGRTGCRESGTGRCQTSRPGP